MTYILNRIAVESILGSIGMLIVGICVTWYGINKKRKILKFKNSGLESEGIVFDLITNEKNEGPDPPDIWIIRFLTKNNIWIIKEPSVYFSHYGIKKGDKVQVFYNPDDPNDFVVYNPKTNPVFELAIVFGLLITAVGLFATFYYLTA